MFSGLMDGMLCCIFAHSTISCPTLGNFFATRVSSPSPEGWNVGTVGRTRERQRQAIYHLW